MATAERNEAIAQEVAAYLKQHQEKELLRLLTCGSVDDGKSTLIGRLLFDTQMIYEDQLAAIKKDSLVHGTTGTDFDPALLTDGLKAEREQGITIDVAYRYFSTARRKFIIADTPGHEQYTRNMATGASNCDLAVILVDARHGVLTQTRRHSFIVSLLGIKHVVVAINKMDLVGWSEDVFNRVRADYLDFAQKLEIPDIVFIPMAALLGDNVARPSEVAPWYQGPSLLAHLESVTIATDRNFSEFRFPVQHVLRPNLDFRGFSGTIASGVVRPGAEIASLPSGRRSRVKSIVTWEGELAEAAAGEAITLTLHDEIDASRGDLLASPTDPPRRVSALEAMVVWMHEEPLVPGREYLIKHTTRTVGGRVTTIRHAVDVNSLEQRAQDTLGLNDVGRVTISLARPLLVDPYKHNRVTGAFIIIDRLSNSTVGAGMVLPRDGEDALRADTWEMVPAGNVTSTESRVTSGERADRFGHRAATVLLTGLAGAGKSTIAFALERRLFDLGVNASVLDGQNLRQGLTRDLGFTSSERSENLRRGAEVAKMLNDAGILCLGAFVAPSEAIRQKAAAVVGADRFLVIHVAAPVDVCRQRDTKGMYTRADSGEISDFPGVTSAYEPPANPDLVLDTAQLPVDEAVARVLALLKERGVIPG